MAIGTDSAIEFFGTLDALDTTSGTVASNAFSVAGDLATWTNDDDAPRASITGELDWAVAPSITNPVVNLYAQAIDTVGTDDGEVPDADHQHIYIGTFPINDVTTPQFITIDVRLPNWETSSVYQFYIENKTGQTIQAAWDMHVTPKTIGPHA